MRWSVRTSCVGIVWGIVALTGLPGFVLSGCESSSGPSTPSSTAPDINGVVFEGLATDEALVIMLGLQARAEPAQSAVIDVPAAQMSLPAATPATFAWHIGELANAGPSFDDWASTLRGLLGPGVAHAHGVPMNGRGYFLVFSTPSSPKLLRVFTTDLTYTPDAVAWGALVSAGEPISLEITNAIFEDNRVAQDGGPFSGSAVSFSITP